MTDDEFKKKLTPEQYRVLREKGTETPFTGKLLHNKEQGIYLCAACGSEVFDSETKFDSSIPGLMGWPSFYDVSNNKNIKLADDNSVGMHRVEVVCAKCNSHLGHLFDDEQSPNGKHYCINSCALDFNPQKTKQ